MSLTVSEISMINIRILDNNNYKLYNILCLYRLPNTNRLFFLEVLEGFLLEFKFQSQLDVLIGDVSINILEINENSVNSYLSLLNNFGFVSMNKCSNTYNS